MARVGIVIVTYNSAGEIGACLEAACRSGAEVVVVDNASADGTVEEARRFGVTVLANADNRGFAAAANQGIAALSEPLILLLNPDAVLCAGLDALAEACARPRTAGASGKLVSPGGAPQTGFMFRRLPTTAALVFEALLLNRLWPRNPVNWHYRCLGHDDNAAQEVEQPAGAFLMVRREIWEELGGFDERFHPLWFEDVDFCKRARDRGYSFYYTPYAVAKHTGGHSIPKIPLEERQLCWYRSLFGYVARHMPPGGVCAVAFAVMAGSLLRMAGAVAGSRSLGPVRVYWKVMQLAGRYFFLAGRYSG